VSNASLYVCVKQVRQVVLATFACDAVVPRGALSGVGACLRRTRGNATLKEMPSRALIEASGWNTCSRRHIGASFIRDDLIAYYSCCHKMLELLVASRLATYALRCCFARAAARWRIWVTPRSLPVTESTKMLADNFVIIVECTIICTRIVFAVRVFCYLRIAQLKNFADRISGSSCPKVWRLYLLRAANDLNGAAGVLI
jgi:hypothetical protein